ncbi:MAG: choice-of-anchor Q domain-containing protein [Dehalococcoidia bacterium]
MTRRIRAIAFITIGVLAPLSLWEAPDSSDAGIPLPYVVTKTTDTADGACDADCSLREAIIAANQDPDPSTVKLPAGHYNLSIPPGEGDPSSGDLDLTDDIVIQGARGASPTIDANAIDRVFQVHCSLCEIEIRGVTIREGSYSSGPSVIGAYGAMNLLIADSVVTANTGRAISGGPNSEVTIEDSTISNNINPDPATNVGGVLNNGDMLIFNSTISGNETLGSGGALFNTSSLIVANVTISGNSASSAAGIYNRSDGALTLFNVTITDNEAATGAGLRNDGLAFVRNTIIANNQGGDCIIGNPFTSQGGNIDSDDSCGLTQRSDQPDVDPLLKALALNGGKTRTHALGAGSPALEAAGDFAPCQAIDQRGVTRPQGGECDSGAYEARYCFSQPETKAGSNAGQTLTGTAGDDVILGLGGVDTLNGVGGDDRLCGGDGDDTLNGGADDDRLSGGSGSDTCNGGAGAGDIANASCEVKNGIP